MLISSRNKFSNEHLNQDRDRAQRKKIRLDVYNLFTQLAICSFILLKLNQCMALFISRTLDTYQRTLIFIIIIINIQPTVKVSCPVGYVMLSSRVELQPLTLVYMGFSGSYLTVNFLGFSNFASVCKEA